MCNRRIIDFSRCKRIGSITAVYIFIENKLMFKQQNCNLEVLHSWVLGIKLLVEGNLNTQNFNLGKSQNIIPPHEMKIFS